MTMSAVRNDDASTISGDASTTAPRFASKSFSVAALTASSVATADPRVAVEIVDYDNRRGLLRHLGLRGRAGITSMDPVLFRRLLRRYLGPDETWNRWFIDEIARIDDPDGRLIRLVPESIFTNDVSYFRTGPALASRQEEDG